MDTRLACVFLMQTVRLIVLVPFVCDIMPLSKVTKLAAAILLHTGCLGSYCWVKYCQLGRPVRITLPLTSHVIHLVSHRILSPRFFHNVALGQYPGDFRGLRGVVVQPRPVKAPWEQTPLEKRSRYGRTRTREVHGDYGFWYDYDACVPVPPIYVPVSKPIPIAIGEVGAFLGLNHKIVFGIVYFNYACSIQKFGM